MHAHVTLAVLCVIDASIHKYGTMHLSVACLIKTLTPFYKVFNGK